MELLRLISATHEASGVCTDQLPKQKGHDLLARVLRCKGGQLSHTNLSNVQGGSDQGWAILCPGQTWPITALSY